MAWAKERPNRGCENRHDGSLSEDVTINRAQRQIMIYIIDSSSWDKAFV